MRRQFDRLLINSRQTRQERLTTLDTKQKEPVMAISKCFDCEKFTLYGKTCKNECDKEE